MTANTHLIDLLYESVAYFTVACSHKSEGFLQ